MRDRRISQSGFTLIELMIVVVIIGILAALALPRFMGATTKSKQGEAQIILKQIVMLQLVYRENATNSYFTSANAADSINTLTFQALGLEIPPTARYSYTIVDDPPNGYLATATGDLDADGVDDIWTIDETGQIQNTQNDVIL